jgi:restriction system protein
LDNGGPSENAGEALGKSGDGGIDGIIRQDRLGLDNIYLQAKRYSENSVGTGEVNSFIGALSTRGASKGVLITTSSFSEAAKRVATSAPHLKLSLIDGRQLATLMIDHDLGVALEARYDIKRIDSDFFCED